MVRESIGHASAPHISRQIIVRPFATLSLVTIPLDKNPSDIVVKLRQQQQEGEDGQITRGRIFGQPNKRLKSWTNCPVNLHSTYVGIHKNWINQTSESSNGHYWTVQSLLTCERWSSDTNTTAWRPSTTLISRREVILRFQPSSVGVRYGTLSLRLWS